MLLVLGIVKIFFAQRLIPAAIDKNFRAIFVIARRQRTRHAVRIKRIDHAKPKAIAFGLMLFGIAIEVFPQHRGQNEFRIDGGLQQIGHRRSARRIQRGQITQRKIAFQIEIAAKAGTTTELPN